MVFSGVYSDGEVPYHCHENLHLLGNLIQRRNSHFYITCEKPGRPVVADVRLMLPDLLGLFVDVTPKVFLPSARVDATGQMM